MSAMRVLAVDDEPLARDALTQCLRSRSDVATVKTASNVTEALASLQRDTYDVLLLDIRMPQLSGMDLLDRIRANGGAIPAIVFVTAFDEYAVEAFERRAVDYVLKPFSSERLNRAIDNAKARSDEERGLRLAALLPQLETLLQPEPKIAIKSKGRLIFLSPSELVSARADGNYVLLQQRNGTHLLREQISTLAERLQPHGFIRIHRSVLINTEYVASVEPLTTGEYLVRMKDGAEFNVTRTYKKNLSALANVWIGADLSSESSPD